MFVLDVEGHLFRKLHGAGTSREDINTYLQVGGLPRVVRHTLTHYQKFLTTLGSFINHMGPNTIETYHSIMHHYWLPYRRISDYSD